MENNTRTFRERAQKYMGMFTGILIPCAAEYLIGNNISCLSLPGAMMGFVLGYGSGVNMVERRIARKFKDNQRQRAEEASLRWMREGLASCR
jgi:hypothetical protein